MNQRFLDLAALDDDRIQSLLRLARELQSAPISNALRGKVLGLLFMNPSLRTLASFQAGMAQLGGSSFVIAPGAGSWALETQPGVVMDGDKPEHIRDAIPVLSGYADALGVRCFANQLSLSEDLNEVFLRELNTLTPGPLINLESAANHPCQALAEWKSLDDLEVPANGRFVLSWTWHPKALAYAVPAATGTMAARRGMDLVILRPEGYDLPEPIMQRIYSEASHGGGRVTVTDDREAAMQGAHILYAKSWAKADAPNGYGSPESHLRHWCADESWFANADPRAKFFHCLPLRRNVEATDAILNGPRSEVQRVANNRLHVQKAVLMEMLSK
ncbi:MAG: N-acetylornithine carbamoyltransferase [Fimbriimonadaceae bacterium]|nr:N-acetylornithine carbamoyltransferase [Fimbriimonadaceae bacterium]